MKISVFGTGYVGLVTGACLANLGHDILCVDIDETKIAQIKEGKIPFYEPGLKSLVAYNIAKKRLLFTTNIEQGVQFGDVIFNCVGTPSGENGSADLSYVFQVVENVARFADRPKFLVNKSTVPPGTAAKSSNIVQRNEPQFAITIVSNPEFLAEGKAIHDFQHPDKIVVGAKNPDAFTILRRVYTGRVRSYIPFLETDWETAETIKYANNSFLATKISFINEIANICDTVGADVRLVAQAMGLDYRISPKFLNAGVGYGGSCFPKDVRALIHTAKEQGYVPQLLEQVDSLNERQKSQMFSKIKSHFQENLNGKTIAVWGVSFKPQTSDTRESPSLVLIRKLQQAGARVQLYDPIALREAHKDLGNTIIYCNSIQESVQQSDAIVLVTEWDEFRNVHFHELAASMKNKVLFDGRNIYEPELVQEEGFVYYGIGRR